jgi:DNA-binding MarR family transcriptional regulator
MMKSLHNAVDARSGGPARVDDALMRLFELTTVLGGYMEQGLTERGLSRARASLIWLLHHDGPATQHAIARSLRVTPRNITGLVDALEADAFVARTAHPTDRRATLVTLTQHGQDTAIALAADYRDGARYLFGDLEPAHVEGFLATVASVLNKLEAAGPNQPAS